MKQQKSHFMRRATALILTILLALPPVYAAAGEQMLNTSATLVDGLTYYNTITNHSSGRVESFSLERTANSAAYPILLQGDGTIYGAATINRAVSYAQSLGYHVLAAVNTDFFSVSSGVPMGIVIEDGVYKSSSDGAAAMVIADGAVSLCETPEVLLTLTNERDGSVVTPNHFNKLRNSIGGMYLLNRDFSTVSTRTSGSGWYIRMKAVADAGLSAETALTVNSTLTLEVTELLQSDQPIVIEAGEYILTADDLSNRLDVYQSFQLGDRITLSTVCTDETLAAAQWAGGVGDVMIRDGAITDSSGWDFIKDGRAPRTALGVKQDGTLLVYAVDGRQSGYSAGLSQMDLAEELLAQGCRWAVNLDGGGSTAISVWMPGQAGTSVKNKPSDGKVRGCATYLLLVTEQSGDGRAHRLAMQEDGLTVLAGSSITLPQTVVLDNGLNLLDGYEQQDISITSQNRLGIVADGVYTAGMKPGVDTLRLYSGQLGIEGTAQIHVVDKLTALTVSGAGSSAALSGLTVAPGEAVQLSVSGSYWDRAALRDFRPVKWTVTNGIGSVDGNGLFTATEVGGTGTITAEAGGQSYTIPVSMRNVHRDVTEGHWAYDAVKYCYDNGIVNGVSTTEFGRDALIRRADFVLMLYNAVGKPTPAAECTFTDVNKSDYYYNALAWGQQVGLVTGIGDGTCAPGSYISREQAFTILGRALPLLGKTYPAADLSVLNAFADRDSIADYARAYTAVLVAQGVVGGRGNGIAPKGELSRAEMAVLLHRVLTQTSAPGGTEKPQEPGTTRYVLNLDRNTLTLGTGESHTLKAVLVPQAAGANITWESSDSTVATVSPEGKVTSLHTGTESTVIKITASWNGVSAECSVTCTPAQRTGTVKITSGWLWVRSGPDTSYSTIGSLGNGAVVAITGEMNGWYQIVYQLENGGTVTGYVSGKYVVAD